MISMHTSIARILPIYFLSIIMVSLEKNMIDKIRAMLVCILIILILLDTNSTKQQKITTT